MPQRKPQMDSSGLFSSKASFAHVPKSTQDTLFFTATSLDWDHKVPMNVELGENFLRVHEIGRRDCRLCPPPSPDRIPLLTHAYCTCRSEFGPKQAGDLDINRHAMKCQKIASAGGLKAPSVQVGAGVSKYAEDFSRILSPAERRQAKPPAQGQGAMSLTWNGGESLRLRSTYAEAHGGAREGAPPAAGEQWLPKDNLGASGGARDFWRSRYRLDHTVAAGGAASGQAAALVSPPRSRWGRRRAESGGGAVPDHVATFLDEMGRSLRSGSPAAGADQPVISVRFVGRRE